MNAANQVDLTETVPDELSGERFDRIAAELFDEFSRSRLQKWIDQGALQVDGQQMKRRDKLIAGARLTLSAELETETHWQPQPINLHVVHEDEALIVLNKPADLVVHPAAGNHDGTLLNGLLHAYPELAALPRGGIVHRLDKDTTGLMVVARSLSTHQSLVDQLQQRSVSRRYAAVVCGVPVAGETLKTAYGRHPVNRLKMAVLARGKEAITHYRVVEKFARHAMLSVQLETGRTHQIRVHLAHRKFPIVGDPLYGSRPVVPPGASEALKTMLQTFPRQALHAESLSLIHPLSGQVESWQADMPEDMRQLVKLLGDHAAQD